MAATKLHLQKWVKNWLQPQHWSLVAFGPRLYKYANQPISEQLTLVLIATIIKNFFFSYLDLFERHRDMERDLFHLLVRSSHVCNGQGWTSSKSTAQTCLGHVRMQGPKHLSHHCCLPGCASVGCWGRCKSEPQSQALPPGMQVSQEGACLPHHSVCALPCCY